jgi:hypothetical protein
MQTAREHADLVGEREDCQFVLSKVMSMAWRWKLRDGVRLGSDSEGLESGLPQYRVTRRARPSGFRSDPLAQYVRGDFRGSSATGPRLAAQNSIADIYEIRKT